jgi:hypothetical protein
MIPAVSSARRSRGHRGYPGARPSRAGPLPRRWHAGHRTKALASRSQRRMLQPAAAARFRAASARAVSWLPARKPPQRGSAGSTRPGLGRSPRQQRRRQRTRACCPRRRGPCRASASSVARCHMVIRAGGFPCDLVRDGWQAAGSSSRRCCAGGRPVPDAAGGGYADGGIRAGRRRSQEAGRGGPVCGHHRGTGSDGPAIRHGSWAVRPAVVTAPVFLTLPLPLVLLEGRTFPRSSRS